MVHRGRKAPAEHRQSQAPSNFGRVTKRGALLHAAVGLASAILSDAASAQDAGQVALPEVTVESSEEGTNSYLAQDTSTATKTNTKIINIPQSISVVTQEQIKDRAVEGIAEAVRYIPGVNIAQGEGNRDQIVIRGQSSTADFFIDGMRDDVQYYRDLYNIQRVEVLKGPNAMIFGRGGGGGILNRVTKEAFFSPFSQIYGQMGSFGNRRLTVDVNRPFSDDVAGRFNGLYENSGSYRYGVHLERYGVNPTLTFQPDERTKIRVGYEFFHDGRTADRGIPSLNNAPFFATGLRTFFGNPYESTSQVDVQAGQLYIEHDTQIGIKIQNFTRAAYYNKFYQNVYPGELDPSGQSVQILAYNNLTQRTNLFNQTNLTGQVNTGPILHKLLLGSEFGYQNTFNSLKPGLFNDSTISVSVPSSYPITFAPITYHQMLPASIAAAVDDDEPGENEEAAGALNRTTAKIAAVYAQDQLEVSPNLQFVFGLRYDNFRINYLDQFDGQQLSQVNNLVSPRAGIIVKPLTNLSFYGSYSVSYLPASGDQFSNLAVNQLALTPQKFTNYEGGLKWEPLPSLLVTMAFYQLDTTNTTSVAPNNPAVLLQTGKQVARGAEIGIAGNITEAWQMFGGYAYQDVRIASTTSFAEAGTIVPLTPNHVFSLWNKYRFNETWAAGLGVIYQSSSYASIQNEVVLPGYARLDGAVYYKLNENLRGQVNIENITNARYYPTATSNDNILPGSPLAVRVGVTATF